MCALYSYKLRRDSGFAPNPFFEILTLATCKADIRRTKEEGAWIAGFTSVSLCRDPVGAERLIYLMKVSEKIPLSHYFGDTRFTRKIPDMKSPSCPWVLEYGGECRKEALSAFKQRGTQGKSHAHVNCMGDNIYRPTSGGASQYEQLPNSSHGKDHMRRDISGQFVLAAHKFYYFGRSALRIPKHIRPNVPRGVAPYGAETCNAAVVERFIAHVVSQGAGVHDAPHGWPENDDSWR